MGRPFKAKKHLPAAPKQQHLGLVNNFERFHEARVTLEPREGKVPALLATLRAMIEAREATPASILSLAGSLMFLLLACFARVGRGGIQPLFVWISEHAADDLFGLRNQQPQRLPQGVLMALGFFEFARQQFKPRGFILSRSPAPPLIAYSDAEWEQCKDSEGNLTDIFCKASAASCSTAPGSRQQPASGPTWWCRPSPSAKPRSSPWSFWPRRG